MSDALLTPLESLLNHLIDNHLVDNSSEGSETLSKFLQLFEQFEEGNNEAEQCNANMSQSIENEEDSQVMFETKAIFTLADFLKSLSANEYYDIAQKIYNHWQDLEGKKSFQKLEKLVKIREKQLFNTKQRAFQKWTQMNDFASLLDENSKMREFIQLLSQDHEQLQQERNILELQTKKRHQINQVIQPLRQSRKNPSSNQTRSSSRSHPLCQSLQPSQNFPIHERLHREAYQKNQKIVINDVIKSREEVKNCTFKPNLSGQQQIYSNSMQTPQTMSARRGSSISSNQREDPFLYERLSKSTKKFNPELLQLQKETELMKDCTFQPQTNNKSKALVESAMDYEDRDQFYDRLYREGEDKVKYKKSLQMLKDHAEVNLCTFQPETNYSMQNSARGGSENAFTRLHSEHEVKQRTLVKIESEYDQKFKEKHPFQPTRIAKQKDQKFTSQKRENSQQRAGRLYDEWKDRDKKIQQKREELQKEEEKLCKLTLHTQHRNKKLNSDINSITHQTSTSSLNQTTSSQVPQNSNQAHDRLYTQGKDKERKLQEQRAKLYKEQGYSFTPHTNSEVNGKYPHQEKTVIDRTKDFIERKENHLKEMTAASQCQFKPQRVTKDSRLAKEWEKQPFEGQENLGDKLYSRGAEIEQRKEKQRQELAVDKNCTFKPQLARRTEKIYRESSASRQDSIQSKSSSSLGINQQTNENRQPFSNKTNNNQ